MVEVLGWVFISLSLILLLLSSFIKEEENMINDILSGLEIHLQLPCYQNMCSSNFLFTNIGCLFVLFMCAGAQAHVNYLACVQICSLV